MQIIQYLQYIEKNLKNEESVPLDKKKGILWQLVWYVNLFNAKNNIVVDYTRKKS